MTRTGPDAPTSQVGMDSETAEIPTWMSSGPESAPLSGSASSRSAREGRGVLDVDRVHRAGAGDAQAQTWLVTRVLPRVRRIARTFLPSPSDADDAAQTALIAILRSAPTYRGEAAVEGWAGRIAVRTTLRLAAEQRRERARNDSELEGAEEELSAPPEPSAAEGLPRDLREYLAALPEAQRTAVLLHHALDHSIDEIADLTDVSPDTVKSRLRLGLAALRKRIRQDIAIGRRRSS